MRSRVGVVAIVGTLQACGGGSTSEVDTSRPGSREMDDALPTPPTTSPRWLAISTRDSEMSATTSLSVVRFDDVDAPEVVRLATGVDGEEPKQIYWSPSGEHIAFVTAAPDGPTSLWVASARDGFARRQVEALPGVPPTPEPAWQSSDGRLLAWMGFETLLLVTSFDDDVRFYRIPVSSLEPELLGTYQGRSALRNVPFDVSRFGTLYSAGSAESRELWLATESGRPISLGPVPSPSNQETVAITWAPDGNSAVWWIQEFPVAGYNASQPFATDLTEETPSDDHLPKIAQVRYLSGRIRTESDSASPSPYESGADTEVSYGLGGTAFAPTGRRLAYGISIDVNQVGEPGRIVLADPDEGTWTVIDGGSSNVIMQRFGFLDDDTFFFPHHAEGPAAAEGSVQMVVRHGDVDRTIGSGPYPPDYFDGFGDARRLFYIQAGIDDRSLLWTVDLNDPAVEAEPVPINGAIVQDSVLKQGQWQRADFSRGMPEVGMPRAGAQALLVAASDETWCRRTSDACVRDRWIVEFTKGVQLKQLDDRWTSARSIRWAVDGSGLIAMADGRLSYIPGPDYVGSYDLSIESVFDAHSPSQWPSTLAD